MFTEEESINIPSIKKLRLELQNEVFFLTVQKIISE
jgi:hypothetical protein